MTIHKEGYLTILVTVFVLTVINVILFYFFSESQGITIGGYVFSLIALVIILQFFRSPSLKPNLNSKEIFSPADGKVVVIEKVRENEYFKDERIQVSIFMSPVNVHINRFPVSGTVKYVKYHPGSYLVAWHPKSSAENERTTIVVAHESSKYEVLFRQIAGALARRIVFYCREGEPAMQSSEFGFIKFGSRVDVFLPLDCKIKVQLNQKVKGGLTSIAEYS